MTVWHPYFIINFSFLLTCCIFERIAYVQTSLPLTSQQYKSLTWASELFIRICVRMTGVWDRATNGRSEISTSSCRYSSRTNKINRVTQTKQRKSIASTVVHLSLKDCRYLMCGVYKCDLHRFQRRWRSSYKQQTLQNKTSLQVGIQNKQILMCLIIVSSSCINQMYATVSLLN